jgi:hypothetical protein
MATVSQIFTGEMRPPATEEEFAELCALAEANSVPDSEIDTSDMPEMTDEELARMVPWQVAKARRRERQKARETTAVG